MSTNRDYVSEVRASHRLLSADAKINDRAILSMLRTSAQLLVKRELSLRRLTNTDSLYTTIPCLTMTSVPLSECSDYVDPINIARTKYKLPKIGESNYQYAVQGVYSINALGGIGKKLKEVTVNRLNNLLKLDVKKIEDYYLITNEYLYVTNSDVEAIRLVAYFPYDVPNEIMFDESCSCGKQIDLTEYCKNPLDKEFKCPGYLREQVIGMTSKKLLETYFKLPDDKSADGNDEQSVNKK